MWTWDSARSPTTGLLGRQWAMPDAWGWTQGKSRFWKNMWILQSSPVPRAGDADIAPAGCIPWIDIRTIIETGQWSLPLFKVSPHPMSRIMVKAFIQNTPPHIPWYRTIQVTYCIEHLRFLDRFGLFFPKTNFWSVVKLYYSQAPVAIISTAEWRTSFVKLSLTFQFVLFFPVLQLKDCELLYCFHLLQSSHDFADSYFSPCHSYLFVLLLYKLHILFLVG